MDPITVPQAGSGPEVDSTQDVVSRIASLRAQAESLAKETKTLLLTEINDRLAILKGLGHNYTLVVPGLPAETTPAPEKKKAEPKVKKAKSVTDEAPYGRAKDGTPYRSAGAAKLAQVTAARWAAKRKEQKKKK